MDEKLNVINLHFTDFCNYNCKYCFADKKKNELSFDKIKIIIDKISKYFSSINITGRINLVGGEPLISRNIQGIINYITLKEIDVSIVTNGSKLDEKFIINNRGKLSMIGISIDSLDSITNKKIGRCNCNNTLNEEELIKICKIIKNNNIQLKINHCISKYNQKEDISNFIEIVKPDRFKLFQMTVINGINEKEKCMQITDSEFLNCCKKYEKFNPIIEKEEEMKNSYFIIDSLGNLYNDRSQAAIGNVIIDDFKSIMENSKINKEVYAKRYGQLVKK